MTRTRPAHSRKTRPSSDRRTEPNEDLNVTIFFQLSTLYGPLEVNLNTANEYTAVSRSNGTPEGTLAPDDLDEYPVAVLSAALLQAVLHSLGLDPGGFAEQAGVATEVVAGAAAGACPAWALPYSEFAALADAVGALWREEDLSHEQPDQALPEAVASGAEPYMVVAAMAGG
jgi:hypothetical protein